LASIEIYYHPIIQSVSVFVVHIFIYIYIYTVIRCLYYEFKEESGAVVL
jgi:hypothetical protein